MRVNRSHTCRSGSQLVNQKSSDKVFLLRYKGGKMYDFFKVPDMSAR